MTSGKHLTRPRFQSIDDSNIENHPCLEGSDNCFFLYEYTSDANYSFSETNSLISNLKKLPSKEYTNPKEFPYKNKAIQRCSTEIAQGLKQTWLAEATLVPIPPSKVKGHTEYDDRMLQVCEGMSTSTRLKIDVRELVIQNETIRSAHTSKSGSRPSFDEIINNYTVDEGIAEPEPSSIGIIDDVITTGCHFKAMQNVLQDRFLGVPIFGIFIARRVFLNDEHASSDDIEF